MTDDHHSHAADDVHEHDLGLQHDLGTLATGEIPEETAGPFPGDGSNGPDVLSESGVVRSDITTSFGSASGVADGVPLTLRFKVYDLTGEDVAVLPGAAESLDAATRAPPSCARRSWPSRKTSASRSTPARATRRRWATWPA